jgi:hypothetical protein
LLYNRKDDPIHTAPQSSSGETARRFSLEVESITPVDETTNPLHDVEHEQPETTTMRRRSLSDHDSQQQPLIETSQDQSAPQLDSSTPLDGSMLLAEAIQSGIQSVALRSLQLFTSGYHFTLKRASALFQLFTVLAKLLSKLAMKIQKRVTKWSWYTRIAFLLVSIVLGVCLAVFFSFRNIIATIVCAGVGIVALSITAFNEWEGWIGIFKQYKLWIICSSWGVFIGSTSSIVMYLRTHSKGSPSLEVVTLGLSSYILFVTLFMSIIMFVNARLRRSSYEEIELLNGQSSEWR